MALVSFVEWQKFIQAHHEAHILQTAEWGELKSAFGWDVLRIIHGDEGVQILFRRLPLGFTVAYIPKPLRAVPSPGLMAEIDAVCKKKRSIFLKVEPDAWEDEITTDALTGLRFVRSPHNIQPPRTIELSLVGSEEDILARMKQKCRYNVRLAEKKGIVVRDSDDLDVFYQLMQVTGGRDGFGVHSQEYYRRAHVLFQQQGMASLLLAEYDGIPLAALMVFARGSRSWYLYGASNDEERNRMPTYLLQWQAIRWAREKGCTRYDLWGVPDEEEQRLEADFENRHDGLWGVYRFKRGFGGQVRRAVQALDKIYQPMLYHLYLWRMKPAD